MKKLLVILLLLLQVPVWAQDKIWVTTINQKPFIAHTITNNQTIFSLSRMYHIALADIANVNNTLYKKGFSNGDVVYIPVTKVNYLEAPVAGSSQPLYYKVTNNETLIILSRRMNVRQSMLQTWNDLPTPNIRNGQELILGWVKYTPQSNTSDVLRNKTIKDEALQQDLAPAEPVPEFQSLYQSGTAEEQQENGLVVFYAANSALKPGVYYAFHNTLAKGTIVKVSNPLNNKSVYARIIGAIPNLEQYQKAVLVLSDNAVSELQAQSSQFFCNIFFK